MGAQVQPVDPNRTGIGPAQSEDTFEGSGFTGAVGADQCEDLAYLNLETDRANRLTGTVPFA
ncbi:hypothetical protein SBA3_2700010 [Candidatus Sulfopaludibacter sp. SbA3]|nr:hypothetical protein SBA3_2700010 [Candidatus Sulfopaludibacter sp. SbA3]